ncbi:MAG: sugar-binding domain-containing protein [Mucilaginibacter sp.]|uniref:glycoside hydrolase family 2 protein n=1 Tax=Mucilaginibacter sp. TaxID=1882438 RepID=UPI0031B1789B
MKRNSYMLFILAMIGTLPAYAQWAIKPGKLTTEWALKVSPANTWQQYPRPQLQREHWLNLNGLWEYIVQAKNLPAPVKYEGKILVPFCIESSLSGVAKSFGPEDRLYYKRTFVVPKNWGNRNVLLNFDAVDWSAAVWVNGAYVGSHKGGYDRFTFDITPYLSNSGSNEVLVAVDDPTSTGTQARGKQQLPQQGIWYTPVSGIWQTVWLEAVPKQGWLSELRITPDVDRNTVQIIPLSNQPLRPSYQVSIKVSTAGKIIAEGKTEVNKESVIALAKPHLWSPNDPFLYDLTLTLTDSSGQVVDVIKSYFGMRKISLGMVNGIQQIMLNNKPVFQYGTLDQGWWPDGLHTPPSEEAMAFDIIKTKEMGFNMIRKHIKVEPDRWYYDCDRLGMLVWQDMPSGMGIDTNNGGKKPIHLQHLAKDEPDLNRESESTAQFEWELRRMIDQHYNSPSIVTWVPLNEGWGQYATERIANTVKALDPTRLTDAISGWSLRPAGDLTDLHTYQPTLDIPPAGKERAAVIGEFGGIGWPVKGHLWNPAMRNWGYQTYQTQAELLKHYKLKFAQILNMKKNKGLSAAVYTQTIDVEGEVNGLITYDRKVMKIPATVLKDLHNQLQLE